MPVSRSDRDQGGGHFCGGANAAEGGGDPLFVYRLLDADVSLQSLELLVSRNKDSNEPGTLLA